MSPFASKRKITRDIKLIVRTSIEWENIEFKKGEIIYTEWLPMNIVGTSYEMIYKEIDVCIKKIGECETKCDIINNSVDVY